MRRKGRLDGLVNDQHLRDLRVMAECPFMRYRRALAEQQVLPPVRRRLDSHDLKGGSLNRDACLLQHLAPPASCHVCPSI
jgi:hypothetical protein